MIRFELPQESVRTGDRLTGHASWSSSGGKAPRTFRVICRWRIEGKGRRKEDVIDTAGGGNQVAFEFEIPLSGPLSYDGKLFRIIWEIVAIADIPFARNEEEVKSFLVLPRAWNVQEWKELREAGEELDDEETTA
ncbi:MAG TPA: hypothetical protein VF505_07070, partial [Thermoanaerobaculia bacterium]